ncbi:MAG: hypothetical protein Q8N63_00775 [Nanoarchaeota archaeon]|nr:hypothetical protein [Nanoarchaeota archaeon]
MLNWIIIFVLVMLGIYVLKLNHLRHRFWIFFLIFLAVFLYVSITVVHNKYDLDFTTFDGLSKSTKVYLGWLGNGFENMKALTGNAIKMDWTSSSNESLLDKANLSIK